MNKSSRGGIGATGHNDCSPTSVGFRNVAPQGEQRAGPGLKRHPLDWRGTGAIYRVRNIYRRNTHDVRRTLPYEVPYKRVVCADINVRPIALLPCILRNRI